MVCVRSCLREVKESETGAQACMVPTSEYGAAYVSYVLPVFSLDAKSAPIVPYNTMLQALDPWAAIANW